MSLCTNIQHKNKITFTNKEHNARKVYTFVIKNDIINC